MDLIEKKYRINEIKKEICWISSEFNRLEQGDVKALNAGELHITFLYDRLGDLIDELKAIDARLPKEYKMMVNVLKFNMGYFVRKSYKMATEDKTL